MSKNLSGLSYFPELHTDKLVSTEIFYAGAWNSCSQPNSYATSSSTLVSMLGGTTAILGNGTLTGTVSTKTYTFNLPISGWYEVSLSLLYTGSNTSTVMGYNIILDGVSLSTETLSHPDPPHDVHTFSWHTPLNLSVGSHTFLPQFSSNATSIVMDLLIRIKKISI